MWGLGCPVLHCHLPKGSQTLALVPIPAQFHTSFTQHSPASFPQLGALPCVPRGPGVGSQEAVTLPPASA